MESPGKRLRAMINAPEILVMPGVFDGFRPAWCEGRLSGRFHHRQRA